jgi:hypothetical protein
MGFDNISIIIPEVEQACKNSIRIHILPPLYDLQQHSGTVKGIDLSSIWAELCLAFPFRVDLGAPTLEWEPKLSSTKI